MPFWSAVLSGCTLLESVQTVPIFSLKPFYYLCWDLNCLTPKAQFEFTNAQIFLSAGSQDLFPEEEIGFCWLLFLFKPAMFLWLKFVLCCRMRILTVSLAIQEAGMHSPHSSCICSWQWTSAQHMNGFTHNAHVVGQAYSSSVLCTAPVFICPLLHKQKCSHT